MEKRQEGSYRQPRTHKDKAKSMTLHGGKVITTFKVNDFRIKSPGFLEIDDPIIIIIIR